MSKPSVSTEPTYKNLTINTNAEKGQGCYTVILDSFYNQLTAMLSHHHKVTLIRFDLHLPKGYKAGDEGADIRRFFNLLTQHLKTKVKKRDPYRSHLRTTFGWTKEIEKTKACHFHCWIALNGSVVQSKGRTEAWGGDCCNIGILGLVGHYWGLVTGGYTPPIKNSVYKIERDDLHSLDKAFYRISYLAKNRGKHYGDKTSKKNFSTSRIKPNLEKLINTATYQYTDEHRNQLRKGNM